MILPVSSWCGISFSAGGFSILNRINKDLLNEVEPTVRYDATNGNIALNAKSLTTSRLSDHDKIAIIQFYLLFVHICGLNTLSHARQNQTQTFSYFIPVRKDMMLRRHSKIKILRKFNVLQIFTKFTYRYTRWTINLNCLHYRIFRHFIFRIPILWIMSFDVV